ncbi:MAG: hypothetical protein WED04_10600 [Promethearchaeati archaeon SRVP18_Atabeyarchaeia-1]
MSTSIEDEACLTEVMGKEYALNIPCVLLYSDGEEVRLWTGSFIQSKTFEAVTLRGKALLIKFAVGDSEVEYWVRKYPAIKTQWQRDGKWREWVHRKLSSLRE